MLHMFETPSPRVRAKGDGVERPSDDIAQALAALFEVGTSPIVLLDLSTGRIERVNARFCELLNYDLATLPSLRLNDVLHLGDRAATKFNFLQSIRTTGSWEGELRHIRADGAAVWLSAGVTVWRRDACGEPTHAIAVLQNVTERRAVLELMRVSEEMLRTGQQVGRIATLSRERDDDRLRFGPMSSAMFGLPDNDDAIPMGDFMKLVHPEDAAELNRRSVEAVARRDVEFSAEFRIVRPSDGLERHIEVRVRYNYDENGVLLGSIGVGIDVTERKEAEQLLELAAWHDALTGLPNRTYFRARLDEACARATSAEPIAVLCLDLDRFKDVNDTLGHPVGDKLLVQVGLRLQAQMRVGDTVARLGGDEFAVIQIGLHEREDAGRLARRLVEKLREPYFIEGDRVTVGASVGVAVSPRDGLRGDHLMKSADLALYEAKAQPNRGWRFFESRMNWLAQARYELDADLRLAIQEKQFEVVYQPMLDAGSLRVQNFEALVRWRHPTKGLIPPDLFIPACEQNGMICQIGELVLRRACADAAGWPGGIGVAVNVSAVQVTDGELDVSVAAALSASGLAPDRLELEVTETALLQDTAATYATIQRVKAMGVRVALDDFGVGHASLDYLQCFPFDKVKIDRSFTREVDRSQRGAAVLRAMLDLCAAFGLPTVVEGVETQAQFDALGLTAGTRVQGHLFSPARPADCVLELIERFSGAAALATAAA
jgi:diguanylate cyclase (GGDEF)-like protein/PAS domain S-box-containing protein